MNSGSVSLLSLARASPWCLGVKDPARRPTATLSQVRLAPAPVQTYSLAFRVSNGEFLLTTIFSRLLLLPPFSALSGEALLQILQLDVNTIVSVRSLCPLNQLTVEGGILLVHKRLADLKLRPANL